MFQKHMWFQMYFSLMVSQGYLKCQWLFSCLNIRLASVVKRLFYKTRSRNIMSYIHTELGKAEYSFQNFQKLNLNEVNFQRNIAFVQHILEAFNLSNYPFVYISKLSPVLMKLAKVEACKTVIYLKLSVNLFYFPFPTVCTFSLSLIHLSVKILIFQDTWF